MHSLIELQKHKYIQWLDQEVPYSSEQKNGYETNIWILVRTSILSQYFKVYLRNRIKASCLYMGTKFAT